jgi:cysteine sulfinate desulfinase/cysteine desulfurase-like protein
LPTHQIIGLSAALSLAAQRREADLAHVASLKQHFLEQLRGRLPVRGVLYGDDGWAAPCRP